MTSIEASFQLQLDKFQLNAQLQLPAHGITVISGASGSGKTLLLRCMAGLEKPQTGYCKVKAELWQDSAPNYFLAAYQRSVGYVFQEACLFPHLTVQQNIDYGRKRVRKAGSWLDLDYVIDLLNIGSLLKRKPERLSGGEKQRVAIARALAVDPQLLLMDEPLAALDQAHKQEILPYLRRLQQELALPILYVTHSSTELMQLADHVVWMAQGRVIASGDLQSVLTHLDLPLIHNQHLANVLMAEVCAYDPEFQELTLGFSGGRLCLPHQSLALGSWVRLRIDARDVSLSLQPPSVADCSTKLAATVLDSVENNLGYIICSLQVGSERLVAQLTRKAASLLKLELGQTLYIEIKHAVVLG